MWSAPCPPKSSLIREKKNQAISKKKTRIQQPRERENAFTARCFNCSAQERRHPQATARKYLAILGLITCNVWVIKITTVTAKKFVLGEQPRTHATYVCVFALCVLIANNTHYTLYRTSYEVVACIIETRHIDSNLISIKIFRFSCSAETCRRKWNFDRV